MHKYHILFLFNDTAPTEIYTYLTTLSLNDALPISLVPHPADGGCAGRAVVPAPAERARAHQRGRDAADRGPPGPRAARRGGAGDPTARPQADGAPCHRLRLRGLWPAAAFDRFTPGQSRCRRAVRGQSITAAMREASCGARVE